MAKTATPPAETLRVRAQSNVLGLNHGDEAELVDSPRVQVMLNAGHLVEIDEAGDPVARDVEAPVKVSAEDTPKA